MCSCSGTSFIILSKLCAQSELVPRGGGGGGFCCFAKLNSSYQVSKIAEIF